MHVAITLARMMVSRRFLRFTFCIKLLISGNRSKIPVKERKLNWRENFDGAVSKKKILKVTDIFQVNLFANNKICDFSKFKAFAAA